MFLKCSYFFYTFQVQFKNVLNFVHLKINENTCFRHMFLQLKNKYHLNEYSILINKNIDKKHLKNMQKPQLTIEKIK